MRACLGVRVAELAPESQILRVLQVIERYRLGNARAAKREYRDYDGQDEHHTHGDGQVRPWQAAAQIPKPLRHPLPRRHRLLAFRRTQGAKVRDERGDLVRR